MIPRLSGLLVGRQTELEAAERFLGLISEGAAALVFEGEAGIGKTAVWREVLGRAQERSWRVLSCNPGELEVRLSYASLADLLADVEEPVLASLPAPQRRALDVALLRADPEGRPPDQRAVCTAVAYLIRALAESNPVVVAVDDAQWLDGPSERVLGFVARRVVDRSVGFVLALRNTSEMPLGIDRALAGRGRRVRVGPLSLGALHQMLKAELGQAVPRATLGRVHRATGGNPFYALELARTLLQEGTPATGEALPIPSDVRDLLRRRMNKLPAETRRTLLLAAATPEPTIAALQRATRSSRRAIEKRLTQAERAGLVRLEGERVRFGHPLYASAVYAAAPPAERRSGHRRLVTLTGNIEQRARHLALATDTPDEKVALALDAASGAARSRGAPDAAAELGELAIQLTPPERTDELRRRCAEAAEHHLRAGDLERGRALLEDDLRRNPAGSARAETLLLLAQIRHQQNSFPEALTLLAEALEQATGEARLAAPINLELAYVRIGAGDFAAAEPAARDAVAYAEQLRSPPLLAEALAAAAIVDFLLGRGLDRDAIERALAHEDAERQVAVTARPSLIAALLEIYSGELESARARLEALRRRVIERGEESDLTFVAVYLAWVECWRGELGSAAGYASEALESAGQLESESLRSLALAFSALVDAHRGEATAARNAATEALELSRRTGWQIVSMWALWALGLLALSLGDAEAADSALGPLAQTVEAADLSEPIRALFLPEAIEALIARGRLPRAASLLEKLEACALRLDRSWAIAAAARCRGLLLATQGDHEPALNSLQEALRQHERAPMPLERARTLLALGLVQRRKGERRRARETLEQAHAIFAERGATLWAKGASGELRGLGGRPTTGDELTPAETRVAELAASGLTNREVAAALFISPKTVEANLARIYRKLGIHSRAELGAQASAETGVETGVT
jgi:DNA-binding CsgD family transcriptional regulator